MSRTASPTPPAINTKDSIARQIRLEIIRGTIPEGQPLREQHLAQRFGVSRGPIRDALLVLTQEGLLRARHNFGVRVAQRAGDESRSLLVRIRRDIEQFCLERIFAKITAADLKQWQTGLSAMRTACQAGDLDRVVEEDMAFHRSIVEKNGDETLVAVWLRLITQLWLPYSRHHDLSEVHAEHRAIVEAIRAKDQRKAVAALMANIL